MSRLPYSLIVFWQDGRREIVAEGHDPPAVSRQERTIARNAAVIRRIELHDLTGCLETLWAADWNC